MKAWLPLIALAGASCTTARPEPIGDLYGRTLTERREGFGCTRAEYRGGPTAPAILALQERLGNRLEKARELLLMSHKADVEAAERAYEARVEDMLQAYPTRCKVRDSDKARARYQRSLSTLERRVAAEAHSRN
jgi:hypothetical protein